MLKDKLKQLRTDRGLSQRIVAQDLEAAQQTVASWEVGRTEPNNVMLKKLARYFGVSTDYLLGNDAPATRDQNLQMYERLPDADRAAVNRMIAALFAQAHA